MELLEGSRIENVYRYSEKVISGAQPDTEEDFGYLRRLGVRTIISVDGARPDVETAEKFGLRYIHIPIGYDSVPDGEALKMAKVVYDATEPVYFHCHHGKHRGPSAACKTMILLGQWNPETAIAVMKQTGTGEQYQSLYQSVERARVVEKKILEELVPEFSAVADVDPVVAAMVNIQHTYDHLLQCREAGWQVPDEHPDIDPPHEALQLREHYHELGRREESKALGKVFMVMLTGAENSAAHLETSLRKENRDLTRIEKQWSQVAQSCKSCHQLFRDNGILNQD